MNKFFKALTVVVACLVSPPSMAGGLFDFDEWMNVGSFGEVGRQRDSLRADRDRVVALERELAAERMKQQRIESLLNENAIIGANLASNRQILSSLELVGHLVDSQKKFMIMAIELLWNAEVGYKGISRLIRLQQSDLKVLVSYGLNKDPDNKFLGHLQLKIVQLESQIDGFPKPEMTGEEFGVLLEQAFQNSNEAITLVDSLIETLKSLIQRQEESITANKQQEKELKKDAPVRRTGVEVSLGCKNLEYRLPGGRQCMFER